ncbi:hypothetical protein J4Q44_G00330060 [Coregonus suidteri]|uniref:Thymus-specific serine protease n=1 Tax=Coregonus suidteri TaxID=861788 RepID=A0AAN8KX26_9TELE
MLLSPIRCIILLLLVNSVYSGRVLRKIKERVRKIQYEKAKKNVLMRAVNGHKSMGEVRDGKIHQPLDHFDSQNDETFPQRFFVNEAYWERPHGPVFLYIGGEGPISEFSVLAGHHVDMAEEHGALLVALEHRFYGKSINEDGLETENLGDLSSQQALTDIAEFHQYISDRFDLSNKNTWISFGGSYAGALSAWLRGKFPHLVYGAVASSAPVVGLSLADKDVGGSDKCVGDIWEAFAAVEAALFAGNATEVGKDFGCCETPEDLEDQIELMQSLADIVIGTVAYNEEGGILTIEELCDIMTNETETFDSETEAYDRLIKLVQTDRATGEEPCLDASHKQTIKDLSDTNLDSAYNGERQWYYQTCTEFGFYQTCEDASCPFSRMLTLQAQTDLCLLRCSTSPSTVCPDTSPSPISTMEVATPTLTGVLEEDLDKEDKDMAILIEGSAHCADMNPDSATDHPALKQARKAIERKVAKWLKEAAWKLMG